MPKAAAGMGAASSRRLRLLPLLPLLPLACGTASQAGRATVLLASGADLQSINPLITVHPLAKQVQKHVLFLTLASYDSTLTPRPRLARWEWSADRTALRLRLRPDVRWEDGVLTTSLDVRWTLEMARAPAVAYPRARDLSAVRRVEAPDSFTVVLTFDRPQPLFPDVLTDLPILPAHRFEGLRPADLRTAAFNRAPIGNGPFRFAEYRPNQRWVFARREGFPTDLGVPHLERLVIAVVDEPATKLAALTSGELDFAGISAAYADFVRRDPRHEVIDYPIFLSYAVVFNLRRPPFDDPRVRRALSRAIDRRQIIDAYLYGFGTGAAGPVSPVHPWYEPVPDIPFDTAAAGRLLDAAGWRMGEGGLRRRDGETLAFDLLTVGSGDLALEQMLQAQWRAVGADARIRRLELSTFLDVAQGERREFDVLVTGIPGDMALSQVMAMYDGDGPLAYPGYRDPALARAFATVRGATTAPALMDAWREVQRQLAAAEPSAWIYHARGVQGKARRIQNVRIDLRGELAGIADWRIAP